MRSVNDPSRFKASKSRVDQTFVNDPSQFKTATLSQSDSEKTVGVIDNQQYGGEGGDGARKKGLVAGLFNAIGIGIVIFIAGFDFIGRLMGLLVVCIMIPFMIYVYFFSEKAVEMRREAREAAAKR